MHRAALTPAGGEVVSCELDAACEPTVCELCLDALPPDEIANPDARDYVQHFCGLDCYARWRQLSGKDAPAPR